MERVALILERSGQRLGCLLNPSSLVVRRRAGVVSRRSTTGRLTGAGLTDDPLLYTGGGTTELTLDLLFDVQLAGSTIQTEDVRDLTGPLWNLAENRADEDGYGSPPLVRFVWGKSWNIPGVILEVAERLEQFATTGAPRRSWLRMRMRRVSEETASGGVAKDRRASPGALAVLTGDETVPIDEIVVHQVAGSEEPGPDGKGQRVTSERFDQLAFRYYQDPSLWRLIAAFNKIYDPLAAMAGMRLQLPPISLVERGSRQSESTEEATP